MKVLSDCVCGKKFTDLNSFWKHVRSVANFGEPLAIASNDTNGFHLNDYYYASKTGKIKK